MGGEKGVFPPIFRPPSGLQKNGFGGIRRPKGGNLKSDRLLVIIFHCFVHDTGYEIPLGKGSPEGIRKCTIILPKKASVQIWTKNV